MYDIAIYLIILVMALLTLWGLFIIVAKPKEVLFGFLVAIRPFPGQFWNPIHLFFFPIWAPVAFLDRKFDWGIYDRNFWK